MICLNVGGVGPRIGVSNNVTPKRICLPYINVGLEPVESRSKIIIFPVAGAVSFPSAGQIIFP